MAADDVMLVGVGAISAVGLSAAEVAASVRSATPMFAETSLLDRHFEPFTLAEVPEPGLPPLADVLAKRALTSREARLARLAEPALRECLAALPQTAPPSPLVLALPEIETTRPLEAGGMLDAIAEQAGGFDRKKSEAAHRGRAGGLLAIARAVEWLKAGAPFVIAGGVDTYGDPYVLGTLDMEERVKTSSCSDGFVPGEGAAFLLLALRSAAESATARPIAALSGFAAGFEPGHLYSDQPYRGEGLATALAATLRNGTGPVREVFSSMNGESHWAKEWGVAYLRNRSQFMEEHGIHHPADCHGDTGAAAGPIMVALAALGIRDGYRGSPSLVYASSDRGERAAVLVNAG